MVFVQAMHTYRDNNIFRYIYRDSTIRSVSTAGNPRVLFFGYRRRFWNNQRPL
jgi:hypothetical protein